MTIEEIFKETDESFYLVETIKKLNKKYVIYSHKEPGKRIGKKEGYETLESAVEALLGMVSKGGFYKKSYSQQQTSIRNYIKRHKLGNWHEKDKKKGRTEIKLRFAGKN